jgi:hypothetical protein
MIENPRRIAQEGGYAHAILIALRWAGQQPWVMMACVERWAAPPELDD